MNLHETLPSDSPHGYPTLWPETDLEHIVANGFGIGMIQADEEALAWAAFVRDVIQPENVMELGTCCGGMFYIMDRMSKPGLRISVDMPWEQRDPKPCWPDHLFKSAVPNVIEIAGNIHDPKVLLQTYNALNQEAVIDLLFIDADHSWKGTETHFEMYAPLVRAGGYIGFHDLSNGWPCGDYVKAELFPKYEHWAFNATNCNPMGIGVIRLPV